MLCLTSLPCVECGANACCICKVFVQRSAPIDVLLLAIRVGDGEVVVPFNGLEYNNSTRSSCSGGYLASIVVALAVSLEAVVLIFDDVEGRNVSRRVRRE